MEDLVGRGGDGGVVDDWEFHCRRITHRPAEMGTTSALAVMHRGNIVHEWYGPGCNADSTLISWSIAKSITHAVVGLAVEDGALSLDQKNLRPEWAHDARTEISLDDLLTMRSGLAWVEDYVDNQSSDVIAMLFGDTEHRGDHASFAASQPLIHSPGEQWLYSSGTTNIISWILGQSIDEPIVKFIQDRLFDPLEMTHAVAKVDATGTFVGSSYVYATARDYLRFGSMYVNDGMSGGARILGTEWVRSGREFVAHDPEMLMSYGRHWWMWPTSSDSMIAHGYKGQILWVCPQRELVVIHLGDTDARYGGELRSMVADVVEAFPISRAPMRHDGNDG